jgi:hypothetical protein
VNYLVKDFLGKRGKKGDLGIEIEVEGEGLPQDNLGIWVPKADRTLGAGGIEYVTSSPVLVSEKRAAINFLADSLMKFKTVENSHRASVHVHSNFLYNTPTQYWTSATAYWLVENLLFNFCDPYRKGNCFCLRLADAEGVLKTVFDDLKRDYPFTKIGTDDIRYAGQNLAATAKFGSIEYRGMSFTLDKEKLDTWTSELFNLNSKVNKFASSPSDLMDKYLAKGPGNFLREIFGPSFVSQLTKQKGWEDELEKNEGAVVELAYFHDWKDWQEKINRTIAKNGAQKIFYNGRDPDAERPRRHTAAEYVEELARIRETPPAPTVVFNTRFVSAAQEVLR